MNKQITFASTVLATALWSSLSLACSPGDWGYVSFTDAEGTTRVEYVQCQEDGTWPGEQAAVTSHATCVEGRPYQIAVPDNRDDDIQYVKSVTATCENGKLFPWEPVEPLTCVENHEYTSYENVPSRTPGDSTAYTVVSRCQSGILLIINKFR